MKATARHDALEYELGREKAGALGVSGRRVRAALDRYSACVRGAGEPDATTSNRLLDDLVEAAYTLLLQREFAGFVHGNVEYLQVAYGFPPEVWRRLGLPVPRHRPTA